MSAKKYRETTKKIVVDRFGPDNEMYARAKERFATEAYVSSGSLQRHMQIPYFRARYILDRMIDDKFCEPQEGAKPCKVLKK
jgi:hypothetical protein